MNNFTRDDIDKMDKVNLPQKICVTCRLPFNWRKKIREKLGRSEIL